MTHKTFAPIPADSFILPFQAVSSVAADKVRKLASLQIATMETYLNLGINQCKAMVAISSPEDFQIIASKQAALMKILGEKALVDMQQVMALGAEFGTEVQNAVLQGAEKTPPAGN